MSDQQNSPVKTENDRTGKAKEEQKVNRKRKREKEGPEALLVSAHRLSPERSSPTIMDAIQNLRDQAHTMDGLKDKVKLEKAIKRLAELIGLALDLNVSVLNVHPERWGTAVADVLRFVPHLWKDITSKAYALPKCLLSHRCLLAALACGTSRERDAHQPAFTKEIVASLRPYFPTMEDGTTILDQWYTLVQLAGLTPVLAFIKCYEPLFVDRAPRLVTAGKADKCRDEDKWTEILLSQPEPRGPMPDTDYLSAQCLRRYFHSTNLLALLAELYNLRLDRHPMLQHLLLTMLTWAALPKSHLPGQPGHFTDLDTMIDHYARVCAQDIVDSEQLQPPTDKYDAPNALILGTYGVYSVFSNHGLLLTLLQERFPERTLNPMPVLQPAGCKTSIAWILLYCLIRFQALGAFATNRQHALEYARLAREMLARSDICKWLELTANDAGRLSRVAELPFMRASLPSLAKEEKDAPSSDDLAQPLYAYTSTAKMLDALYGTNTRPSFYASVKASAPAAASSSSSSSSSASSSSAASSSSISSSDSAESLSGT